MFNPVEVGWQMSPFASAFPGNPKPNNGICVHKASKGIYLSALMAVRHWLCASLGDSPDCFEGQPSIKSF